MAEIQFGDAVVVIRGDMRELAEALGQSRGLVEGFAQDAKEGMDDVSEAEKKVTRNANEQNLAFLAVSGTMTLLGRKASALATGWMHLAGRVDTLEISLKNVGRMAGYSEAELFKYRDAIKAMGITTRGATQAAILFIQSQLDLSKASKLARVAQDLAVIAGTNSTEMFNRMTDAISKQAPILLRTAGITTGLTEIYRKYSRETGVAVSAMDEAQKKEAMLNYILDYGTRVFGTYESAMGSAYKQMGSMARYAEEMALSFGEYLQPAFMTQMQLLKQFYKFMRDLPGPIKDVMVHAALLSGTITSLVTGYKGLVFVLKMAGVEVTGFTSVVKGLLTTIGPVTVAILALSAAYVALKNASEKRTKAFEEDVKKTLKAKKTYEEYKQSVIDTAYAHKRIPYYLDKTGAALYLEKKNVLMSEEEWTRYKYGIDGAVSSMETLEEGMLSLGASFEPVIYKQREAAQEFTMLWAQAGEAMARALPDMIAEAQGAQEKLSQLVSNYAEQRAQAAEQEYINAAKAQAQYQAEAVQAEAEFQAKLAYYREHGREEEAEKLIAQYEKEKQSRKAAFEKSQALAEWNADIEEQIAKRAHMKQLIELYETQMKEIEMRRQHMAEVLAQDVLLQIKQSGVMTEGQRRYLQALDTAFGSQTQKEAEQAIQIIQIQRQMQIGKLEEAIEGAKKLAGVDSALYRDLVRRHDSLQKYYDDHPLIIKPPQYGTDEGEGPPVIEMPQLPDIKPAQKQTETAVEKLSRLVSNLSQVAREATDIIEKAIGFTVPKGFEEAFQRIADAMVLATKKVYDAWQESEGKANQAAKYSDHVRKILSAMKDAADIMRQAERPARLTDDAAKRIADFMKSVITELSDQIDKYDKKSYEMMERYGLATQSIMDGMTKAVALAQSLRGARLVEEVPQQLFDFLDSLLTGLTDIAAPDDDKITIIKVWAEKLDVILGPIRTAIDAMKALSDYKVKDVSVRAQQLVYDVGDAIDGIMAALAPWGRSEYYSTATLERQMQEVADLLNAWGIGVTALNNVLGPALSAVKALTDYKTPKDLGENAAQVVYDVGDVIDGVMEALAPWGRSEYYSTATLERQMQRVADLLNAWNLAVGPLSNAIKDAVDTMSALSTYTRVSNIREKTRRLVNDIIIVLTELQSAIKSGVDLSDETAKQASDFADQMQDVADVTSSGLDAIASLRDYVAAGSNFEFNVQSFLDDLGRMLSVFSGELGTEGLTDFPPGLADKAKVFAEGMSDVASITQDGLDSIAGLRDYVQVGSNFRNKVGGFLSDLGLLTDEFGQQLPDFPDELKGRAKRFNEGFAEIASLISGGVDSIDSLVNLPGIERLDEQTDTFLSALVGSERPPEVGGVAGILPKFDRYLHDFTSRWPNLQNNARQFDNGLVELKALIDDGVDMIEKLVGLVDIRRLDDQTDTFLSALMGSANGAVVGIVPKFDTYLADFSAMAPNLLNRSSEFAASLLVLRRDIQSGLLEISTLVSSVLTSGLDSEVTNMLSYLSQLIDELNAAVQLTDEIGSTGRGMGWKTIQLPQVPLTTPDRGGNNIMMNVTVNGGINEYETARRLVDAAEMVSANRGMNMVRAGYRR